MVTAEARGESVVGIGWDDSWPRAEQVALFFGFRELVLGAASSVPCRADREFPPLRLAGSCLPYQR